MPQQIPKDLSRPAPGSGELLPEVVSLRKFGPMAVQDPTEFLNSRLMFGDDPILLMRLMILLA